MNKLDMSTSDLADENIAKIAKLFPNVITEKEGDDGEIVKAIDFDLLKQELSKDLVEDDNERYRLDWPGKKASLLKANTPIDKTLRPDRESSVDFDNTENVYIEGDNFEVLKILQESYLGKIKMIYIDPPYNTGKDFVYCDNTTQSKEEYEAELGVEDEEGGKLFKNTDTNGRFHSDWFSMMYERLVVARDLLKDDGVIFMSIGDNEIDNLRKVCDEVFGESNFVELFIVRSNPRGNQAKKHTASEHEYIICYAKDLVKVKPLGFSKSESEYTKSDDDGRLFREIGLRKRGAGSRRVDAPNQYFPIYYNSKSKKIDIKKMSDDFVEILPKLSNGEDGRWRWSYKSVLEKRNELLIRLVNRNGTREYDVFQKDYFSKDKISKIKSILYEKDVNYENGTEELKFLFNGKKYFDYPKPVYLLKTLEECIVSKNCIVLDFFSGSATTAHAIMQLNIEDGGNRKFIMAQLPEKTDEKSEAFKEGYKTISEIGMERIRRAGKKILEENKEELKKREKSLDIGFRVYRTDTTNMKDVYYNPAKLEQSSLLDMVDNIKEDRTSEDLLTQVILDLGLTLDLPIETKKIKSNKVFL